MEAASVGGIWANLFCAFLNTAPTTFCDIYTGWKSRKISFLLKTPVHFPEVQTPWNLNFRMNPAPQPRKPPRLFCQRNVIFGQHGFIWSWHIRDMSTYMSTSITLSMITKKNQSYVLRVTPVAGPILLSIFFLEFSAFLNSRHSPFLVGVENAENSKLF